MSKNENFFESQNDSIQIPLIDKVGSLIAEDTPVFEQLLTEIRQLRWFIVDQLPHLNLDSEQEKVVYQLVMKVIMVSTLQAVGVKLPFPSAGSLIAELQTRYNIQFESTSFYSFDSDSMGAIAVTATRDMDVSFEQRMMLNPDDEMVLLEAMLDHRVFHLGFLSKGLIYAYLWLNKRLSYLVHQQMLERDVAVKYLNENLAFAAIKRVSSESNAHKDDPEDTYYIVALSPEIEAEIAVAIENNREVAVVLTYDEVISKGKSFMSYMEYLINKFGERVIDVVKFFTPDFDVVYVPEGERWDFTTNTNPDGSEVDPFIASPIDENQYKYVWRINSPMMGRYQSIGFNPKDSEA